MARNKTSEIDQAVIELLGVQTHLQVAARDAGVGISAETAAELCEKQEKALRVITLTLGQARAILQFGPTPGTGDTP